MKMLVLLLIASVVLVSGCTQYGQQAQQPAPLPKGTGGEKNIEITGSGFSPSTMTVDAGNTVTFINKDSKPHWPASAVHPSHGAYPEPGGCIGSRFDACKGLNNGEVWKFTFNQKGTWKYHDHLNPGLTGTVVVK